MNRPNYLAALVSKKRQAQFKISHSNTTPETISSKKFTFNIPIKEIANYIETQKFYKHYINQNFETLEVSYENLTDDYPKILEYLGLKKYPFEQKLEKLNRHLLQDTISNYHEVMQFDKDI